MKNTKEKLSSEAATGDVLWKKVLLENFFPLQWLPVKLIASTGFPFIVSSSWQ